MGKRTPLIVIADDDDDDRFYLKEAFERCREKIIVHLVEDGVELMDYLYRRWQPANSDTGIGPISSFWIYACQGRTGLR